MGTQLIQSNFNIQSNLISKEGNNYQTINTNNCQDLPIFAKKYQQLSRIPTIVKKYQQLSRIPTIVKKYQQLPRIPTQQR